MGRYPGGADSTRLRHAIYPSRFNFAARSEAWESLTRGRNLVELAAEVSKAEGKKVTPGELLVWWHGEGRMMLPHPEAARIRVCCFCGVRRVYVRRDTWVHACRSCYRILADQRLKDRKAWRARSPIPLIWPVPCAYCRLARSEGETRIRWKDGKPEPWDKAFICSTCLSERKDIDKEGS